MIVRGRIYVCVKYSFGAGQAQNPQKKRTPRFTERCEVHLYFECVSTGVEILFGSGFTSIVESYLSDAGRLRKAQLEHGLAKFFPETRGAGQTFIYGP